MSAPASTYRRGSRSSLAVVEPSPDPVADAWRAASEALDTPDLPALLDLEGVASYLSIHPDSVRRIVRAGQLPAYRVGKRSLRFRRSDIADYLSGRRIESAPCGCTGHLPEPPPAPTITEAPL